MNLRKIPALVCAGRTLMCCLAAVVPAHAANLISNGSFESPTAADCSNGAAICRYNGVDSTWVQGQNMGGWTIASSSVDLFNAVAADPADGGQWVDLQGDYGLNGGLYQDVSTVAGQDYLLTFAMSGGTYGCEDYGPNGSKTAVVKWGAETVLNPTVAPPAANKCVGPIQWTYFKAKVTATSDLTRLLFADDMPWYTAYGMGLDDVQLTTVSAVPIPGTLGLLGIGLAGLGFVRRKAT